MGHRMGPWVPFPITYHPGDMPRWYGNKEGKHPLDDKATTPTVEYQLKRLGTHVAPLRGLLTSVRNRVTPSTRLRGISLREHLASSELYYTAAPYNRE